MSKINIHDFYCINCGKKAMSLPRPQARKREQFHRKKLYCPWCKKEINCIECNNNIEVEEFKQRFKNNEFIQEAKISMELIK